MKKEHFTYLSNDHVTLIHAVRWIPEGKIHAILQIAHGMAEYVERYEEFAVYLAENGILVTGNDHLGHGESVRTQEDYGYFAEKNGNVILLKDIHRLRRMTEELYPKVPYLMLGHSMGSFLIRQYLCGYAGGLSGVVIMGTAYFPRNRIVTGLMLTRTAAALRGWRYRSPFLDRLILGRYGMDHSRKTPDAPTKNEEKADDGHADGRGHFRFTVNAYYNLFLGLYKLTLPDYLANVPRNLPVCFTSGAQDPVGNNGKGVLRVYAQFKELGLEDVKLCLYPGDRHDVLKAPDREKVYTDLLSWMERKIEERGACL